MIRELDLDSPEDVALGGQMVRDYMEATVAEMRAGGLDVTLESLTPLVPDLVDFAARYRGGAFLVEGTLGCVGITPAESGRCEMNRLWVAPGARGSGLGERLARASMERAAALGFDVMALDVLPSRQHAVRMYERLGFLPGPLYHSYDFPMLAMERSLAAP